MLEVVRFLPGEALSFEIKLLTPNGRVLELYYHARDGRLLKTEEE